MRDRISLNPESVTVSLELPWDVAEQLVEQGPAILDALRHAMAQRAAEDESRKRLARYHDERASDRIAEWDRLSRRLDWELRRRCQNGDEKPTVVFREFAAEFGVNVSALRTVHAGFTKRRNEAMRKRRAAQIIRLYFLGYTHEEIGRRVRPQLKSSAVGNVLAQNADLLSSLKAYEGLINRSASPAPQSAETSLESATVLEFAPADETQEQRQLRHLQIGRELYREWLERKPSAKQRYRVLRELAERYKLNVPYVEHLIAQARRKARQERDKRVIELYRLGKSNAAIAREIGIHDRTVASIVRKHRATTPRPSQLREGRHV